MQRLAQLKQWLSDRHPGIDLQVAFAAADADFRRYFRATFPDGSTRILMDAQPDKMDTAPYAHAREVLAMLNVPQIYAHDREQGFMELQDLGNVTYMAALQQESEPATARLLLLEAIDSLIEMQRASRPGALPNYDRNLLQREVDLFPEWFAAKELQRPLTFAQRKLWDASVPLVLDRALAQPQVFVHRDYIVRNLMLTDGRPGVLDFQDAVYGPITYDLVSLLRDAFIEFDEELVLDIVVRYWEKARKAGLPVAANIDDFYRDFEWMGVQRHLKVAGIFCRLWHRDGKERYLPEVPRFLKYLKKTTRRYQELAPLYQLLVELDGDEVQSGFSF
ncbi:MAG: phosphotransferase [Paludibacterium sp.]|uniref:N-acetylmuramate/N-acetylglucosamine kinase AmgK n=1 Tax=Paludibacterium sp. TaxID=1917523 RepID=UPI0025CD0700|nr:phosphotransferase [Paludibacterium sp.]MBV8047681.1 phosphotransferase [Paludibacterium sp.]MBV8648550.1 phosphotransferase [Paludibacterium sp.]